MIWGIDWLATAATIAGTYLQSRGTERALLISFIVLLVGNVLWGVFAVGHGIWSMVVTGCVFGTLNVLAFYRWRRKRR